LNIEKLSLYFFEGERSVKDMGYLPGILIALNSENELTFGESVLLGILVFLLTFVTLKCFFGLTDD